MSADAIEAFDFQVDFYLNTTTTEQAAARGDHDCAQLIAESPGHASGLAIFTRLSRTDVTRPGDTLRLVHTATIRATSTLAAVEEAYAIGNGARAASDAYYDHRIRSLSTGDVVVVHTPDGPGAYACDRFGWHDIDLRDFQIGVG